MRELRYVCYDELLHGAVSRVLKDEGFSLPSISARTAKETAEKLLDWSNILENKPAWTAFAGSPIST